MIPLTVFLQSPDTLRVAFRYDADTVAAIKSSSRIDCGVWFTGDTSLAKPSRRLVSPLMAEGTTTI